MLLKSIAFKGQSADNTMLIQYNKYNYDLQRIRRCAVHYAATDGRLYPFCTYNSGYTFRSRVEKQYVESKKN